MKKSSEGLRVELVLPGDDNKIGFEGVMYLNEDGRFCVGETVLEHGQPIEIFCRDPFGNENWKGGRVQIVDGKLAFVAPGRTLRHSWVIWLMEGIRARA
jgi:hypothetical protein